MKLETWFIFALAAWASAFAATPSTATSSVPPARREATIVSQFGNTLDSGDASSSDEVGYFYVADLVIPAATTRELSEYASKTGGQEAIDWFCDAYAEPSGGGSGPSLRTLAEQPFESDAIVGPGAARALVCPTSERAADRRFGRFVKSQRASELGIDGTLLGVASCHSDDEARATFSHGDCKALFDGSGRSRHSFVSSLRRAARHDTCLRLRINEHVEGNQQPRSVLTIGETNESCEKEPAPDALSTVSSCKTYTNSKAPFCVGGKCNLCGPILDKYLKLGGPKGLLGLPITDSLWTPKKPGAFAHFTNGSIFWSSATGAHEVHGRIRDKYAALGWENSYLGFPSTDETATPKKPGRYNHFEGGSIYWSLPTDAHTIRGRIRDKWAALGWENSFLGFPTTDETSTPNKPGKYNHFQGGSIYWSLATDAHEIHGAIRDKWAALGWENGFLGFPVTDELATPKRPGRFTHFQGGSIYWSAPTGAHEVHGAIRDKWASLGWENGFGFPTSDEHSASGGRRSNFEHGFYITWANGVATPGTTAANFLPSRTTCGIATCTWYWDVKRTLSLGSRDWGGACDAGSQIISILVSLVLKLPKAAELLSDAIMYARCENFSSQVKNAVKAGDRCLIYKHPIIAPPPVPAQALGVFGTVNVSNSNCKW